MLETVKKHPYLFGGAAIGTVIIIYLASSGGSQTVSTGPSSESVAAGNALQMAQLQSQAYAGQINAELQAREQDNAAQIELAKIQGQYGYDLAELQSNVALAEINANQQSTALVSTLQAQVAQSEITADQQKHLQSETTTRSLYEGLFSVQRAQIESSVAISKQQNKRGLFSKIFG